MQGGPRPLPALYLAADAIDTRSPRLMGRQSAGHGFLRGFVRAHAATGDPVSVITPGAEDADLVERQLAQAGWQRGVRRLPSAQPAAWNNFEVLYYPAPFSDRIAWQRARRSMGAFALCGVTHTISSEAVMRQLAGYVDGPFGDFDALVCTSHSVLTAVESIWRDRLEFLAWRFDAKPEPKLPMLPVIPLGVHCDDFTRNEVQRRQVRARLGYDDDEFVVLFVGRLSLHAKANPLPMYLACAQAARRTGVTVRVLECGWFANEAIQRSFDEAAVLAGVRVDRIDGREPGAARDAYAAADVFVSLSDNIQETFGLTPVEAMAAGLPVVVSDWDGYRETVRDGRDGLLVPTRQVGDPEAAADLCYAYEDGRVNYDVYVAHAHLMVAVDVEACASAIATLATDPELRLRLGASGRERARGRFDWSVVMRQYQDLWQEQSSRLLAQRDTHGARANPAMPNPLRMFAHYPSAAITSTSRLSRALHSVSADGLRALQMWGFAQRSLPDSTTVAAALARLPTARPGLALEVWAASSGMALPDAQRLAAWLMKAGLIRID